MATKRAFDIVRDRSLYRSIAFTRPERLRLGLPGLLLHYLPYRLVGVLSQRAHTVSKRL